MEKNKRMVLKYPVLVEGKYDKIKLSGIISSPVITADGFSVFNSAQKQKLLRRLTQNGKIIVLTDSDSGGRLIRSKLKCFLPPGSTIDLYIPKIKGREKRKTASSKENLLGVEGMEEPVLFEILADYADGSYCSSYSEISSADFYADGFLGRPGSAHARALLASILGLPDDLTSKALLQAVNMIVGAEEYAAAKEKLKGSL